MPGTTFLEKEDKQLVQIAHDYAERGTGRITWKDVAQKMKRRGRSPAELAQRVTSLKRTFGTDLSKFPRQVGTSKRQGDRSFRDLALNQGQEFPRGNSRHPLALEAPSMASDPAVTLVERS
ncbi:hypothetical protein PF011_g26131 [Phytophthora fragariae]|uniref:Myb-like domain-containing protein n=1 Tax=Phytophthora fragariae TaxID=53985 RepID=A0A6A3HSX1_9STRA|nr:hypothetical protein PF011_g26131 [Phytophthora fragariae]